MKFIFNKLIIVSLISLFIFFVSSLIQNFPLPWPDESLYFSIAKKYLSSGKLGIPFFSGYFYEIENHQYFYPPFFFVVLGFLINIFNDSYLTGRIFSLTMSMSTVIVLYFFIKNQIKDGVVKAKNQNDKYILVWIFLILLDPVFFRGSLIGRMDSFCFFLSFLSIVLVHINEKSNNLILAFFIGLILSASFLTHPMGWSAVCSYILYSIYLFVKNKKNEKSALVTTMTFLTIIILYYSNVYFNDYQYFIEQFKAQLKRKEIVSPTGIYDGVKIYESLFKQYFSYKLIGILTAVLSWIGLLRLVKLDSKFLKFLILHSTLVLLSIYSREMWYPYYFIGSGSIGLVYFFYKLDIKKSLLIFAVLIGIWSSSIISQVKISSKQNYLSLCENLILKYGNYKNIFLMSLPDVYFCFNDSQIRFGQFIPDGIPVFEQNAISTFSNFNLFIKNKNSYMGEQIKEYLINHTHDFSKEDILVDGFNLEVWIRNK